MVSPRARAAAKADRGSIPSHPTAAANAARRRAALAAARMSGNHVGNLAMPGAISHEQCQWLQLEATVLTPPGR